jgi:RNase H-fold protein (predicted Holliday junction resolvase)
VPDQIDGVFSQSINYICEYNTDEHLPTRAAYELIIPEKWHKLRRGKSGKTIDSFAATVILQQWLHR